MNLRSCSVDFIEKEGGQTFFVPEDRSGVDLGLAFPVDVRVVDEVIRHQVNGSFDAFVGTTDTVSHGAKQRGFSDAYIALHHYMSAAKDRCSDQANCPLHADHGLPECTFKRLGA